VVSSAVHVVDWTLGLAEEVARRLRAGEVGIIDDLTRRFEESCIRTGLAHTGGRKVEAAHCWAGAAIPSPARFRNWYGRA
jgi:two-component system nitrogen regulation response regulator GlnG